PNRATRRPRSYGPVRARQASGDPSRANPLLVRLRPIAASGIAPASRRPVPSAWSALVGSRTPRIRISDGPGQGKADRVPATRNGRPRVRLQANPETPRAAPMKERPGCEGRRNPNGQETRWAGSQDPIRLTAAWSAAPCRPVPAGAAAYRKAGLLVVSRP